MSIEKPESAWVVCGSCGGENRRHRVLYEKTNQITDDESYSYDRHHQLLECMGCEKVRYKTYCVSQYPETGREFDVSVWSSTGEEKSTRSAVKFTERTCAETHVPENVLKMYRETIDALNAHARTLAGGGLRATVEAICLAQGITSGSLEKKIDELASRNLLTTAQAQLLHEERFLGNAALHELATPSVEDIEDGLRIVEGLITTLYVLPVSASALRKRRADANNYES